MTRAASGDYKTVELNRVQSGFSLLELMVTLCVIVILLAASAYQYQKRVDDSRRKVLQFQEHAFTSIVENVRAVTSLQNSSVIDLGTGVFVVTNDDGWPVAAGLSPNISYKKMSETSCRSLWLHLFEGQKEQKKQKDMNETVLPEDFGISLVENYICRYKQFLKQEESYFVDYDVRTGNVVANVKS